MHFLAIRRKIGDHIIHIFECTEAMYAADHVTDIFLTCDRADQPCAGERL